MTHHPPLYRLKKYFNLIDEVCLLSKIKRFLLLLIRQRFRKRYLNVLGVDILKIDMFIRW